jgi:thioredoxin 1
MKVTEITEGKVLYKISASWCLPCRKLTPITNSLKSEGLNILEIDIDENPEIAEKYNIRSVPTVILLEDGKEIDRFMGLRSKEEILNFYNQTK